MLAERGEALSRDRSDLDRARANGQVTGRECGKFGRGGERVRAGVEVSQFDEPWPVCVRLI